MRVYSILLLILLSSCSHQFDYVDLVDSVVDQQIRKLCKTENLEPFGYGGSMCDNIKEIKVRFVSYQKVDISEARRMIVKCIDNLKNAVNQNKDLSNYLLPYPFPLSGMNVGILFFKDSGGFVEHGCVWLGTGGVSLVDNYKDSIYYSSYNPRTKLLERYYEETYEEAVNILNNDMSMDM